MVARMHPDIKLVLAGKITVVTSCQPIGSRGPGPTPSTACSATRHPSYSGFGWIMTDRQHNLPASGMPDPPSTTRPWSARCARASVSTGELDQALQVEHLSKTFPGIRAPTTCRSVSGDMYCSAATVFGNALDVLLVRPHGDRGAGSWSAGGRSPRIGSSPHGPPRSACSSCTRSTWCPRALRRREPLGPGNGSVTRRAGTVKWRTAASAALAMERFASTPNHPPSCTPSRRGLCDGGIVLSPPGGGPHEFVPMCSTSRRRRSASREPSWCTTRPRRAAWAPCSSAATGSTRSRPSPTPTVIRVYALWPCPVHAPNSTASSSSSSWTTGRPRGNWLHRRRARSAACVRSPGARSRTRAARCATARSAGVAGDWRLDVCNSSKMLFGIRPVRPRRSPDGRPVTFRDIGDAMRHGVAYAPPTAPTPCSGVFR